MLQAEIRHSASNIDRSQKRIEHQRDLLAHIADPVLLMVCENILSGMEAKLVTLQSNHRDLLARIAS